MFWEAAREQRGQAASTRKPTSRTDSDFHLLPSAISSKY
ncbi:MAG TPA: hypothetical protein DCM07_00315, partial [Planctomycetaceae bacterium]|nr:hypothetical protein [Planctomycetaceae bacterium]